MFGSNTSNLLSNFSFSKIISGVNKTVSTVNQIIPIYKQVTPVIKNVRNAFSSFNSVKNAVKEEQIKEIKNMERPISEFKDTNVNNMRGSLELDTLTFFGNIKNN